MWSDGANNMLFFLAGQPRRPGSGSSSQAGTFARILHDTGRDQAAHNHKPEKAGRNRLGAGNQEVGRRA
jgi:hypothetical protein